MMLMLCFLSISASAQRTVYGSVIDNLGNPVPSIELRLIIPESGFVYKTTRADTIGVFDFGKIYYSKKLFLEAEGLNYLPFSEALGATDDERIIVLQRQTATLTAAEVTAERELFEVSGDTLTFSPDNYLKTSDRTLGDLIARIPELELSGDGSVKYRGKSINALLIGGKDVFNNIQSSATNSVGIEHIENIQIIHNYRGFGDMLVGQTNKVVLNVSLKEASNNTLLGSSEIGFGTEQSHSTENSLSVVNGRYGINLRLDGNTSAKMALSSKDYLNSQLSINDVLSKVEDTNFKIDDLLPGFLRLPEGIRENREGFASLGGDATLGPFRVRSSILGTLGQRFAVQDRIQFGLDSSFTTNENITNNINFINANVNIASVANDTATLSYGGALNLRSNSPTTSYLRSTLQEDTAGLSFKVNSIESGGKAFLNWKARNSYWAGKLESFYSYAENRNFNQVSASSTTLAVDETTFPVESELKTENLNLSNLTRYENNNFNAQITSSFAQEKMSAASQLFDGRVETLAQENMLANTLRVQYTPGQWSFTTNTTLALKQRTAFDQTSQVSLPSANLFAKWEAHRMHFALARIYYNKNFGATLSNANGVEVAEEPFVSTLNNANPFAITNTRGVTISYFNRKFISKKLTFLSTSDFNTKDNDVIAVNQVRSYGWQREFTTISGSNNVNVTVRAIYKANKNLNLSYFHNYLRSVQSGLYGNEEDFALSMLRRSLTIRHSFSEKMDLSFSAQRSQTSQQLFGLTNNFANTDITVKIRYRAKAFSVNGDVKYNHNYFERTRNTTENYFLNASVAYNVPKTQFELFLKAQRIAIGRTNQSNTIENLSINNLTFQALPPYLQIGAGYRW